MTHKAESLLRAALELTESERAEIAGRLLESIEPEPDAEVEAAWAAEIDRRARSIDAGEVELIPWEQVRDQLRSRLNGGKKD